MADMMQFDLVSPERRLASGMATSVQIPGTDGDMTAMPGHAPVVTTLRPGLVIVEMETGREEYAVTGGFAQITSEAATVLADEALPRSEFSAEFVNAKIAEAEAARDKAEGAGHDDASKRVEDFVALLEHMA